MKSNEHSPSQKSSESKSQQRSPEAAFDPQEFETRMATESVQRFMDGRPPPLTPARFLAIQRKVGNKAAQRMIIPSNPCQDREIFQFGEARRRQANEATYSAQHVPYIQRQGEGGAGGGDGGGGAGGGSGAPDSGSGGGRGAGPVPESGPIAPPAPGPPVKFGIAGTGVSFSLEEGDVTIGYEKSDDIISKEVGPVMVPLATGIGIVMSATLKGGLTGGGSVKGSVEESQPGESPQIMQETAKFDASLEFKIAISGEVYFGLGAGMQAVNLGIGIKGGLEFATKYKPRVTGYAIRYSYPENGAQSPWDDWTGEITMEHDVRSEIVAQLQTVGRWHILTESGDWFVIDIGNWPIYEIYSVGSTRYGMPDGDVSKTLDEGVKFLGVPMDVANSGQGKPPWESQGQSGSGQTGPGEGSGGDPGQGRQGGGGGIGPATVGEISEGEDILSEGQGGTGGSDGRNQEEGLLSGGGQGGASAG